jgi:hypothetical protein
MKGPLLLVCVLIAFVGSFCMSPPDVISQLTYGLISAAVCAALVWISQRMLLKLTRRDRAIVLVSVFWAVFVPCVTHFIAYVTSM